MHGRPTSIYRDGSRAAERARGGQRQVGRVSGQVGQIAGGRERHSPVVVHVRGGVAPPHLVCEREPVRVVSRRVCRVAELPAAQVESQHRRGARIDDRIVKVDVEFDVVALAVPPVGVGDGDVRHARRDAIEPYVCLGRQGSRAPRLRKVAGHGQTILAISNCPGGSIVVDDVVQRPCRIIV